MSENILKVKSFLIDLDYHIIKEEDGVFVTEKPECGISNLFIACQNPILIVEQVLCRIEKKQANIYKQLLQKNRDIIHGAFAIDPSGEYLLFRDTLQIENLDFNELEATLNSLELLLFEYQDNIIDISKK